MLSETTIEVALWWGEGQGYGRPEAVTSIAAARKKAAQLVELGYAPGQIHIIKTTRQVTVYAG